MTKILTPFCRPRRADSKYIYYVGSLKVFFYYNYIIGGKNSTIVQIPRLSGTYIYKCHVTTIILFEVFLVWLKASCLSFNNLFNCDFFVISFMVFSEEPIITVLFVLRLFLVYYCNAKGLQYFLTSFY